MFSFFLKVKNAWARAGSGISSNIAFMPGTASKMLACGRADSAIDIYQLQPGQATLDRTVSQFNTAV